MLLVCQIFQHLLNTIGSQQEKSLSRLCIDCFKKWIQNISLPPSHPTPFCALLSFYQTTPLTFLILSTSQTLCKISWSPLACTSAPWGQHLPLLFSLTLSRASWTLLWPHFIINMDLLLSDLQTAFPKHFVMSFTIAMRDQYHHCALADEESDDQKDLCNSLRSHG